MIQFEHAEKLLHLLSHLPILPQPHLAPAAHQEPLPADPWCPWQPSRWTPAPPDPHRDQQSSGRDSAATALSLQIHWDLMKYWSSFIPKTPRNQAPSGPGRTLDVRLDQDSTRSYLQIWTWPGSGSTPKKWVSSLDRGSEPRSGRPGLTTNKGLPSLQFDH